jgi:adenine/guanine phosphoribosyltransferase-like PRPP-binding protein
MLSDVFPLLNDPIIIAAAAMGLVIAHFLAAEVDDGF